MQNKIDDKLHGREAEILDCIWSLKASLSIAHKDLDNGYSRLFCAQRILNTQLKRETNQKIPQPVQVVRKKSITDTA